MSQPTLNLTNVTALIVDPDKHMLGIVSQILRGLGLNRQFQFATGKEAEEFHAKNIVDLCIFEAVLPDMSGYDLVKRIRQNPNQKLRFVPVMILTGYTQMRSVATARDCGANLVVKKPVSAQTLFDHIAWMSRSDRPFVEVGDYVGPDRRFKSTGHPSGVSRRKTDQQAPAQPMIDVGNQDAGNTKPANV